jgi:hypothetical protein
MADRKKAQASAAPAPPPQTPPSADEPGEEETPEEEPTTDKKGKSPKVEKDVEGDVQMSGVQRVEVENTVSLTKTAKVATPPKFRGDPAKLKEFIAKLQIYMSHNSESFDREPDKVLFAISYLEGPAFDFMEVYLNDYNNNTYFSRMRQETREMFKDINKFIEIMTEVYGEPYEDEKATYQLLKLKMRNSYPEYMASFLQYAPRVQWDDNALRTRYYEGLTEELKDKLLDHEKPKTFLELRNLAMKIWNRLRERKMEKGNTYLYPGQKNLYSAQGQHGSEKDNKKGRKWRKGRGGYNQGNDSRNKPHDQKDHSQKPEKREGNCHNCGKPGHWARECRSPNKEIRSMEKKENNKGPKGKKKQENKTVAQMGKRTEEPTRTLAMAGRYWNELPFSSDNDNDSLYESAEEYQNRTRSTIQHARQGTIQRRRRVRIQATNLDSALLNREVSGVLSPPPPYEFSEEEQAHGEFYSGEGASWAPPGYPEEWTRQEEIRQIEKEFPCLGEQQQWYKCFRDWCETHKAVKDETNYWPRPWHKNITCPLTGSESSWVTKWTDCTAQRCLLHFQNKFDAEYFPTEGIQNQRDHRVNPEHWREKDNLYYPMTDEEKRNVRLDHDEPWYRWQNCIYGSCLFHVSQKIHYGVMGNPYHFDTPNEFPGQTKTFNNWEQWNKAIVLCNIWGSKPRTPSQYQDRPTQCDNADRSQCTSLSCETHRTWKEWTGYFPDKWSIANPEYGWEEKHRYDPSNLHYQDTKPEWFRNYTKGQQHQQLHWTNCIVGSCEKHYAPKIKHNYVPTWKHWIDRIEEETLKATTLQPRGC